MTTMSPAPSAEALRTAHQDLAEDGVAVLPGVLSAEQVADVRSRLVAASRRSAETGMPTKGYSFDPDERNTRVFMLVNHDDVFIDLVQHELALEFVHSTLGEQFLISNFSANITGPGAGAMKLHADQQFALPPWPSRPLAVNVAWLLDDFTETVGATRYVPGSHLRGHAPEPDDDIETVPVEAPAGSLMVMDGRMWHRTGANTSTDRERAGLFGFYVLPWVRPQINWNAFLEPEVARRASDTFLDRLGYRSGNSSVHMRLT